MPSPQKPQKSYGVSISIRADRPTGPYRPLWNWFGYDEPNYTYSENGKKLVLQWGSPKKSPLIECADGRVLVGPDRAEQGRESPGGHEGRLAGELRRDQLSEEGERLLDRACGNRTEYPATGCVVPCPST